MFILKPIHKKIQERLIEKQNWMDRISPKDIEDEMGRFKFQATSTGGAEIVPNPLDFESDLNDNQIFTRTTWVRMSAANNAGHMISIMGGEMGSEGTRWGGPTTEGSDDATLLYRKKDTSLPKIAIVDEFGENVGSEEYPDRESSWRPVAGIKSLSSEYQNYSIRNTTINWIAWDYESINDLTPYFLSNGASVLIEWGWSNKNEWLSGYGPIKPTDFNDAYIKLQDRIFESRGDYDAVAGMVKNFQWKTRDDGGFDCTTELTSMGINILEQSIPGGSGVSDAGAGWKVPKDTEKDNDVVPVDLQSIYNNRFENFLEDLEVQLDFMFLTRPEKNYNFLVAHQSGTNPLPLSDYSAGYKDGEQKNSRIGPYVTWGWMEDNLLNRFFGQTSFAEDPVLEIRSILPKLKEDGEKMKYADVDAFLRDDGELGELLNKVDPQRMLDNKNSVDAKTEHIFESCKCINSPALLTTSPKRFILKGQWPDISTADTFDPNGGKNNEQLTKGAKEWIIKETYRHIQGDTTTPPRFLDFAVPGDDSSGYIRNIILHWSIIQDAFGGAGSLTNGFNNLFAMLNAESGGIWDFELVVDENNGGRSIVIDKNHSTGKIIPLAGDTENTAGNKSIDDDYQYDGLFVFPVFSTKSIVKSQNIETNISSEMGTMLMLSKYGNPVDRYDNIVKIQGGKVNADVLGTLFNPFYIPDPVGEKTVDQAAFAAKRMAPYFDGLQSTKIAQLGIKYGNNSATPNDPLRKERGFSYDPKTLRTYEWNAIATEIQNNVFGSGDGDDVTNAQLYQELVQELQEINIDVQDLQFESTELPTNLFIMYNKDGEMTGQWKMIMHAKLSKSNVTGIAASINPTVPLEISLEIDGTGGIFPGNSFHTNYVPETYRKWCCFQCSAVEHSIDSSGWTTTIKGLMTIFIDKLKDELAELIANAVENDELSGPEIKAQAIKAKKGREARDEILRLMETYRIGAQDVARATIEIDVVSERSWDYIWPYYVKGIGSGLTTSTRAAANSNKKFWTWQGELEGSWKANGWIAAYKSDWNYDAPMGSDANNGSNTDHDDTNTFLGNTREKGGGGSSINNALYRISNAISQAAQDGNADLTCGYKWQQTDGVYARSAIITDLQWLMNRKRLIYLQIKLGANGKIWNPLYINSNGNLWYDIKEFKENNSIFDANKRNIVEYKIYVGPFKASSQAYKEGSNWYEVLPEVEWWQEGSTYPRRVDPLSVGGLTATYLDETNDFKKLDAEPVNRNDYNPSEADPPSRKSAWIGESLEYLYKKQETFFTSPTQWFGKLKNLNSSFGFPRSNTSHRFDRSVIAAQTMIRYQAFANKNLVDVDGVQRKITISIGNGGLLF